MSSEILFFKNLHLENSIYALASSISSTSNSNCLFYYFFVCLFFCFVENPVCFEESYRIEVLVLLRRLERLDQDVYAEDERQEAEEVCHYVVEK